MNDWRMFRPAIWLAMLGVAVMLLVAPFYLGAVLVGAAVGIALRIEQGDGFVDPSRYMVFRCDYSSNYDGSNCAVRLARQFGDHTGCSCRSFCR